MGCQALAVPGSLSASGRASVAVPDLDSARGAVSILASDAAAISAPPAATAAVRRRLSGGLSRNRPGPDAARAAAVARLVNGSSNPRLAASGHLVMMGSRRPHICEEFAARLRSGGASVFAAVGYDPPTTINPTVTLTGSLTVPLNESLPLNFAISDPLAAIPGRVPPLDAMPAGCRFAPRCPMARAGCELPQVLATVSVGHSARCHVATGLRDAA